MSNVTTIAWRRDEEEGAAVPEGSVVVVGATSGLGLDVARTYAAKGYHVVMTGRDAGRTAALAASLDAEAAAFDLSEPATIAPALAAVGPVRYLVLAAIERDSNTVAEYDMARAMRLVTLKLVGYTEVVHTLRQRLRPDAAVVIFGGLAKERPYPGSTTVTTINGGVVGLTRTLAHELAPIRVNSIHPAFVADTPFWSGKPEMLEQRRQRTLTGRNVVTADITHAVEFLLENQAVNGVDLFVDGGWVIN
jgi:NAD(P)-dependent dehydrogenase (short-subunit alcohol dehydrogenase family)